MNLRKLLCGLLALCLLLTMAPAALMEEAPVEEVVFDLEAEEAPAEVEEVEADAIEADDFYAIPLDKAEETLTLPTDFKGEQSGSTYLALSSDEEDASLEIAAEEGYYFKKFKNANTRVVTVEGTENEDETGYESLTLTGVRTGDAKINLTMAREGSKTSTSIVLTVHVYDPTKPYAIEILNADDEVITEATIDVRDAVDGGLLITGNILPEDADTQDIYWTTSNKKIATVALAHTLSGDVNTILPKGKGTATITAKCGNVKATVKVKVTDNYAPKSITLKTDLGPKVGIGFYIDIYTLVKPYELADEYVTMTLSNTTNAKWYDAENEEILTNGKTVLGGSAFLVGLKEGTVTITAKTYNGKKDTLKITVVNPFKPDSIAMYGFYNKEKYPIELYNEEWTEAFGSPAKPVKNAFLIVPQLFDTLGDYIDPENAKVDYANIKWTSSNSKVATVKLFKNVFGYSQDDGLAGYDGEVYDDDMMSYAAIVEVKGTGSTKITAKIGKKSFYITLNVVNSHKANSIVLTGVNQTVYTGEIIDMSEYVEVIPDGSEFYGTLTVKPSHSTSKVTMLTDTIARFNKAGKVTFKAKTSDGKEKKFNITIKD